ncbi:MAG: hypothetical protein JRN39_00655 [Nitrososphaerota archaeon]|nr:hypothetical protein [Nitrososphaerota archaeon]MDG6938905.1 hypothetical protein [Nitrososphaerota archaeon]
MVRTNVAIDESIAYILSDEAGRQNKTLYAFTNELLSTVLKITKEGGGTGEIYASWRFMHMLREIDSVPLPGDLLEKLINKLFDNEKEWLLKAWYEEGAKLGTYLQLYQPKFEELADLAREVKALLPMKKVEVIRGLDTGDSIEFSIKAIGAGLSPASTNCAERFVHGILSAYSMKIGSSRASEGIIEIKAAQPKAQPRNVL